MSKLKTFLTCFYEWSEIFLNREIKLRLLKVWEREKQVSRSSESLEICLIIKHQEVAASNIDAEHFSNAWTVQKKIKTFEKMIPVTDRGHQRKDLIDVTRWEMFRSTIPQIAPLLLFSIWKTFLAIVEITNKSELTQEKWNCYIDSSEKKEEERKGVA